MIMPGETLGMGAPNECPDCKTKIQLEVLHSPAGFYIGALCQCGPYCRESGYYSTREIAEKALAAGDYGR